MDSPATDPRAPAVDRLDSLATWVGELDARVRAAELATGDEKTAKELRKAVEAVAKHDPRFHEKVRNHVDVLTDRVSTLAATVSTATAAVAGKEGEIAALRRELSQLAAHVAAQGGDAAGRSAAPKELDDLRGEVARLAQERYKQVGGRRIAGLEEKLRLLTERLDSVSGTVSTVASSLGGREGDVLALQRRLEEESARTETTLADLRRAVASAPVGDLRASVEALAQRIATFEADARRSLVAFGVDLDAQAQRVAKLDAALAESATNGSERAAEIEALREQAAVRGRKLEELHESLERAGAELTRVARELENLDGVVAALAETHARDGAAAASLVSRFEAGSATVDGLVRELRDALEALPAASPDPDAELAAGLDRLRDRVAALDANTHAKSQAAARLLDELARRLGATEAKLNEVAERRGEQALARQLDELERALANVTAAPDASLVAALEEQARRVASVQRDVERLRDDDGFESLSARLHGLERAEAQRANALEPFAGEGRFRVELRALELRVEHAEAAARESREVVLAQMEALARKIDSRLEALEPTPEPVARPPRTVVEGQVVPIRAREA